MKNEVLKKIFEPAAPASITATVLRRIAPGRYELQDDANRLLQADSSGVWSPGTRVIVAAGRIIAETGSAPINKIYEV